MNKIKIACDLDGVLADFWNPYFARFGKPKKNIEITINVDSMHRDRKFWTELPVLNKVDFEVSAYVTKRNCCKTYSKKWLEMNGFPKAPVYQVWGQYMNKADFIKGRVDCLLDDDINNYHSCNKAGLPCILVTNERNKKYEVEFRVNSLRYEEIANVYKRMVNAKVI